MTPYEFSITVVEQLTKAGYLAYWAGGCVRDYLRGKEPNDFDIATNATPDQVRQVFGSRRTLAVGESFGVIIVLGPKSAGQVEVATFRSEGEYSDGRRPDSVVFCSPEQDAQRRDFTINGMFYDPLTCVIHDYVAGKVDLEKRIVRAIGHPQDRMEEDKLRMLRAVRFASVLDFELDHTTALAIQGMAHEMYVVSAERIAQEFRKMLGDVHRARAIKLVEQLGLLKIIVPEISQFTGTIASNDWVSILEIQRRLDIASFTTSMGCLLRDVPCPSPRNHKDVPNASTVQAVCRRLKLSNEETETICWLVSQRGVFESLPEQPLSQWKRLVVHPHFEQLQQLERAAAEVESRSIDVFFQVEEFLKKTPRSEIDPPELLTGKDLIQAGYKPGPDFKHWLHLIRDKQLNNEMLSKSDALAFIHDLQTN